MDGVILRELTPNVANLDCNVCLKNLTDKDWRLIKIGGRLQKRPAHRNAQAPCRVPEINGGCPKGTPENPKTHWPENVTAYQFHKQCRAVGHFPDDAIVRRNAEIIESAERHCERRRKAEESEELASLILTAMGRR